MTDEQVTRIVNAISWLAITLAISIGGLSIGLVISLAK